MRFLFEFLYLVAAVLFIVGLKFLSSPARARQGNSLAAFGMVVATVTLLAGLVLNPEGGPPHNLGLIVAAIAIGAIAGAVGARRVAMTDMPQMVAILNGCGGGSAALISTAEFLHLSTARAGADTMFGTIIGSISLSGSVVAFAKLQGLVSEKAINSPVQKAVNALLFLGLLGLVGMLGFSGGGAAAFYALLGVSLAFGVLMVMPIGGADMPVVISLLNSFTGLAVAATGFVLHNNALIISGTLVGASGTLLTMLMCRAMNRSLANVLFAGFGGANTASTAGATGGATAKPYREVSVDDAAVLLANVQSLIIVPGYGMAVAQAQHALHEMADHLKEAGVEVKYAIHPVAGRMPGHMNVLLAEANVPYDEVFELEDINSEF
ncbi:MAG TPA: NAD(P)(+) transhydrogenase (Re/Si-specific) subunit beta, partial [Methylomirabilota bacterium]|nr:NAD(P)(+) transhydrogenase (Re/Si-specific) subunit beta [Methylomirabilota bacterium]